MLVMLMRSRSLVHAHHCRLVDYIKWPLVHPNINWGKMFWVFYTWYEGLCRSAMTYRNNSHQKASTRHMAWKHEHKQKTIWNHKSKKHDTSRKHSSSANYNILMYWAFYNHLQDYKMYGTMIKMFCSEFLNNFATTS